MAASCRVILRKFSGVILSTPTFYTKNAIKQHSCRYCMTASTNSKPWQLMSGVCVERYPVISQPLSSIEDEFKEMCDAVELESSILSEHEIQVRKDRDRLKKRQDGSEDEVGGDDGEVITALDQEDMATEKLHQFQAAPRLTEADKTNDVMSVERRLSDKLVLLVKERIGEDDVWLFPQGFRKSGESMREAAERLLSSCTEENRMKVKFQGNAPVGVYKYKYPHDVQERLGVQGAKVFFFKAKLLEGDFKTRNETNIKDYKWLSREELDSHLLQGYSECIKNFIMPVTW